MPLKESESMRADAEADMSFDEKAALHKKLAERTNRD
jgi:hypothetical protein